MGQRHQIYVAYLDKKQHLQVIGAHHQWLYGRTAVLQACRMMEFVTRMFEEEGASLASPPFASTSRDNSITTAEFVLSSIYSIIPEQGYYHRVHLDMDVECKNPLKGDNNDGVTIFDFADCQRPKYCMMNVGHIECEECQRELVPTIGQPFPAAEYLDLYYPPKDQWDEQDPPVWEKAADEVLSECQQLKERCKNFLLLTREECEENFPEMYEELGATTT